jgi:3-hydroxypropanoate dehydrogenase
VLPTNVRQAGKPSNPKVFCSSAPYRLIQEGWAVVTIDDCGLDQIFRQARTHHRWRDAPVSDEQLHELYDLMKWGPTSANSTPARILFLKSPEAKKRLAPALLPANVDQTMSAPVTAIIGYDKRFYEFTPKLMPQHPAIADYFAGPERAAFAVETAFRNGSLQGAYLIIAARAIGLDCGAMSGFDNTKVDAEFFPDGRIKSNFLCNLGYGDHDELLPRNPRLSFSEACRIL